MDHDDDFAVGVPILILILGILGIGVYNEIDNALSEPETPSAVEVAADYTEDAEAQLRAAQEANDAQWRGVSQ